MNEPTHEIRIALVLYGGVSLAIYENGVVRCFHDLVQKRGIFSLLLEMMDADATVDVVAGTSAGGINGLMLAAALESGSDFSTTADLWRKHGDFGSLLRDVNVADEAESLLDGETYYQEKLEEVFTKLCRQADPRYESPGEMDVFITGTDLDGRILHYWDDLNQEIRDKTYRTVFHLKHRPGRKWLGMDGSKEGDADAVKQGWILASIARITGTFPAAFPPFRLTQFKDLERRQIIKNALAGCAGRINELDESNSFIDGGVLDNKPFGPVLQSIFYRMPTRLVNRHLFYVEPDPDPYSEIKPDPKKHTPLGVVASALTTIPSHESIYGDLEKLKQHNASIAWIDHLTRQLQNGPTGRLGGDEVLYRLTRVESVVKALLLKEEIAPSAQDQVTDETRLTLMGPIRDALTELAQPALDELDALDADFQLRRMFRILYEYHDELENRSPASADALSAMRLLSRVIKSVKVIRDMLIRMREEIINKSISEANGDLPAAVQLIYQKYRDFLDSSAVHWLELVRHLDQPMMLTKVEGQEQGFIPSRTLSNVVNMVTENLKSDVSTQITAPRSRTILELLATKVEEIVNMVDGGDARFTNATAADRLLYPMQFAAGIHELDRIRLTRISPRDAQKGLSAGNLEDKVTGENFSHFSAFLRRDWRSNDILRGRIDGLCQILRALLNAQTLNRLKCEPDLYVSVFTFDRLRAALPLSPEDKLKKVLDAWNRLQALWSQPALPGTSDKLTKDEEHFVDALIEAAQYDAFLEDVCGVSKDVAYQEIVWGRSKGSPEVAADAADSRIEQEAAKIAEFHVASASPKDLWNWFQQIGKQTVVGQNGQVPYHILGEYVTRAYLLLWGMAGKSLGKNRSFMGGKVRRIFRTPVRVLHDIIFMLRHQIWTAALAVTAVIAAIAALSVISFVYSHRVWGGIFIAFGISFIFLFHWMTPDSKKSTIFRVFCIALLSGLTTTALAFGIMAFIAFLQGRF